MSRPETIASMTRTSIFCGDCIIKTISESQIQSQGCKLPPFPTIICNRNNSIWWDAHNVPTTTLQHHLFMTNMWSKILNFSNIGSTMGRDMSHIYIQEMQVVVFKLLVHPWFYWGEHWLHIRKFLGALKSLHCGPQSFHVEPLLGTALTIRCNSLHLVHRMLQESELPCQNILQNEHVSSSAHTSKRK